MSQVYDVKKLYSVQILKVKIDVWPKVNPFIVPQKPSLSLLTKFNSFSTQNISTISENMEVRPLNKGQGHTKFNFQ